jgi:hypothetical protein
MITVPVPVIPIVNYFIIVFYFQVIFQTDIFKNISSLLFKNNLLQYNVKGTFSRKSFWDYPFKS